MLDHIKSFLKLEAAGGILLMLASALALIAANSSLGDIYRGLFHETLLLHAINDGLMAVFFLLVGLEIKRELTIGELSSKAKAALPVIAAIGGMAVPALVYLFFNRYSPETIRGWAIPGATDIAFALAVMAMLGSRVPLALKIFLTAIAIIDDLGAILLIAVFYSSDFNIYALLFALLPVAGLFILNRTGHAHRAAYLALGVLLWVAILKSGVHATMAGVITAFFIPVRTGEKLEHDLHPWVAFLILPLFGFANAGVSFAGIGAGTLTEPVTLGILLGLFVGKQIGVFGASWLAIQLRICPKPDGTGWGQIYGVALLCGIGFTMSLFIGGLAFADAHHQVNIRLGVLAGSLLSAVSGYMLLRYTTNRGRI